MSVQFSGLPKMSIEKIARKFHKRFIVLTCKYTAYILLPYSLYVYKSAALIYGKLQAVSVRLMQNRMARENNLKLWHYFIQSLRAMSFMDFIPFRCIQYYLHDTLVVHMCLSWVWCYVRGLSMDSYV